MNAIQNLLSLLWVSTTSYDVFILMPLRRKQYGSVIINFLLTRTDVIRTREALLRPYGANGDIIISLNLVLAYVIIWVINVKKSINACRVRVLFVSSS